MLWELWFRRGTLRGDGGSRSGTGADCIGTGTGVSLGHLSRAADGLDPNNSAAAAPRVLYRVPLSHDFLERARIASCVRTRVTQSGGWVVSKSGKPAERARRVRAHAACLARRARRGASLAARGRRGATARCLIVAFDRRGS